MQTRNMYTFGVGTLGRDMLYTMVTMYLIFYLTDVLKLSNWELGWVTLIIMFARIFDAVNDPFMGLIIDNTKTRFGKFKPWIAGGVVAVAIFTVLLFSDFKLTGGAYIIVFAFIYVFWGIAYTANDISYWSMLPALSVNQKEREKIGSFTRICANIGLFAMVSGIVPITKALEKTTGSMQFSYFLLAVIASVFMLLCQAITLIGVKEQPDIFVAEEKTKLSDMPKIIFQNDQLVIIAIAMTLFMTGYIITTSFGIYFFKYAYKNIDAYSIFAVILGVSQIVALLVFPFFRKKFSRKVLYIYGTTSMSIGYILFFLAPMNIIYIGLAGVLIFTGQGFLQILMLMFLTDTVEYGQWKFGKRNESITFALQPFIYKLAGAIAGGIVGFTLIISGINSAEKITDVSTSGLWIMKVVMLILPIILIIAGCILYLLKYKIDKTFYDKILKDLEDKGRLHNLN